MGAATRSQEWFELPDAMDNAHRVSASIRAWVPGDGLACRSANMVKTSLPCTAPVVAIRTKSVDTRYSYEKATTRTAVYCAHHAAGAVRRQLGDADYSQASATTQIVKAAQEKLAADHWDEYQENIRLGMAAHQDRYLGVLPEWLRAGIAEAEAAEQ